MSVVKERGLTNISLRDEKTVRTPVEAEIESAPVEALKHDGIVAALAAAQAELKNPTKDKVADAGKYKYNYADIGDVLEVVRPVFSKHGLAILQPTEIRDGVIVLRTIIAHEMGGEFTCEYPVCSISGQHQAMGAAITYARRYALTSLIGIACVDDTDGAGAAPVGDARKEKMSVYQAKKELGWDKIQKNIDESPTLTHLKKCRDHLQTKVGDWPDSFVSAAYERIQIREIKLADEALGKPMSLDGLSDTFANLEAELEGRVPHEELSSMYSKYEREFSQ